MKTVKRVARMSLGELACRARQQAGRWVDAVAPAFGPAGEPARWWERRAHAASVSLPRQVFMDVARHRFFAGADAGWLLVADPERSDWTTDLQSRAASICDGRFDLLGYQGLEFGDPLDWHLDPVSGKRAPLTHWAWIDPLDAEAIGDSKVIWELNRHQWMVTLGQAYRLTGDRRFADAALNALDSWIQANPYPRGINWASSLEAAYRLIAWCWTLFLVADAPALTDQRFSRWQTLMRAHARHVERYLSHYYSPNTHLTGEALGLLYAGLVFAGSADAARWRDIGRRILIEEVRRQFSGDGTHFERSTAYQRYTVEIYLHLLILAARNRLNLPAHVPSAVADLVRGLMTVMQPDHSLPAIGDADGGCLLPLVRRDAADARGVFAVAAVVFDEPDFAWAAQEPAPEVAWLFGLDGERQFARLARRPPMRTPSTLLPRGGHAVMRSGWDRDAHQLLVDVGPLGCPVSSGHGHADLLSLHCVVFGEPFIVDPGTFCYTADRTWRDHFRGTGAHSTIVIDGRSQADPVGPFSWASRPDVVIDAWETTPTHDFLDARHGAYGSNVLPIQHRRRVLFLKPSGWIVIDDLKADGDHRFELRFQFSPRNVTLASDGWARAEGARGHGLWVRSATAVPVFCDLRIGSEDPRDGWVSPDYGVKYPAPALVSSGTFQGAVRLVTVLLPAHTLQAAPPTVELTRAAGGEVIGVRLPGETRAVHFDAATLTVEHLVSQRSS